jgi:hypothetical protein
VPGTLHQGLLSLFCDDPWLAFDLLGIKRPVEGTPLDRRSDIDRDAAQLQKIKSRYPDLVLVYRDPENRKRGVVICIEAQSTLNRKKRWRIPGYHGALADDHELETWVVIASFSRSFSAAIRVWSSGPPPRIDALLLDVDSVPVFGTLEQALARPTAAVLVAALHGSAGNLEAARMAIEACRGLPEQQRQRYNATVLAALPKSLRHQMMGEMSVDEQDKLMDIERRSGTYFVGHEAGLAKGIEQGIEQGRRMTLIELILALCEVRGVAVDPEAEAKVRACESLPTLQRWARAARSVTQIAQLFD